MQEMIQMIKQKKMAQDNPICAYVYDLDKLREHLSRIFRSLPDSCQMFYAMKANSDPRILKVMSEFVYGFEVASLGEVKKARSIDTDIPILFGGPGKTDEEIKGAIKHRVSLLHIESLQELQRVEMIANSMNEKVSILLRVNLRGPLPSATLQMAGRPTQFGIDESEIDKVIQIALVSKHVKLEGFHLHSISNQLDHQSHVELIKFYCDKVQEWAQAYRLSIPYINVGGGIGVNYENINQQFEWELFTSGLEETLERRHLDKTKIIFECGRFLVAACGFYVAEVLDIKKNHDKNFAIVRGGTQHFRLPVSWQHNHPFIIVPVEKWDYPFSRKELEDTEVTIVGQLCTPKDVFAKDVHVGNVSIGDVILFQYAGAYGWAISHHDFLSHPHPEQIYKESKCKGGIS
jgi:diaminopimelate decarboxylase